MHHRLQLFIHLRARGLRKGDEHPAYTPCGYDTDTVYLYNRRMALDDVNSSAQPTGAKWQWQSDMKIHKSTLTSVYPQNECKMHTCMTWLFTASKTSSLSERPSLDDALSCRWSPSDPDDDISSLSLLSAPLLSGWAEYELLLHWASSLTWKHSTLGKWIHMITSTSPSVWQVY